MKQFSVLAIFFIIFSLTLSFPLGISAEQCGRQARGATCPNGLCCSQFGWCGSSLQYCGNGCQSQCSRPTPRPTPTPSPSGGGGSGDVGSIVSQALFDGMLKYRNDKRCPSNGFYSYGAFITAARSFNGFGTTGDINVRKREIAAFLAQTSHETTGTINSCIIPAYKLGY